MTKKLNPKKPRKGQRELKRSTQSAGPESESAAAVAKPEPQPVRTVILDYPPPEHVVEMAMAEPNIRLISDYNEAIRILRGKGFTFREIAEWLGEKFDIKADHNAVYRAYTKYMTDQDAAAVGQEAEEEMNAARP
jgi:hypothetical protein